MKPSAFINKSTRTSVFASIVILIGASFVFIGCNDDCPTPYELNAPSWFPEMEIPADNQLSQARIDLGKRLFYEPLLSLDSSVSCATCHLQENAFSDGLSVSIGVNGALGMRNAPTLANIGYAPLFFHDGGVETLELQAQSPIFAVEEMNFSIAGFLDRIAEDDTYKSMFRAAYDREPDAFGISRALASFQRTMISGNSRFDQYYYQNDLAALSESEIRGMNLFLSSETQCESCHQLPLFTNFEYENVGLYSTYADSGRARITHLASDNGRFKVPTLRNVEVTGPYMHDGSMVTLAEVVEHFNSGGVGHENQNSAIQPLNLSEQDKEDLVAFLRSLTDESFLNNADFAQ